ncbi:MAG: hypothetical protein ACO38Q_02390 [Aquiluna sp.]
MRCECGRTVQLLAEGDSADKVAVTDLTAQAKEQSGDRAALTMAKVEELRAEIKAAEVMARAMGQSRKSLLDTLEAALSISSPEFLLGLPREALADFILQAGFGLTIDDFIEQSDRVAAAALEAIQVLEPTATTASVQAQLDSFRVAAVDAVFQDVIIPDTTKAVREALQGMTLGVSLTASMGRLSDQMQRSEGRQLTELRTKIASYGRQVTAAVGESAGLDLYLYTGPRDGITRQFCKPLINKVVDDKQMAALNNGQGLPVKLSGGGYNCRHSWSPVSQGFVDAANLTRATAADIAKANQGA